jgi:hypothetical protein
LVFRKPREAQDNIGQSQVCDKKKDRRRWEGKIIDWETDIPAPTIVNITRFGQSAIKTSALDGLDEWRKLKVVPTGKFEVNKGSPESNKTVA